MVDVRDTACQMTPAQQRVWHGLLAVGRPRPLADPDRAGELRSRLEAATADVAALVPDGACLWLNKSALAALECDGRFLDREATPFVWSAASVRGQLAHIAIEIDTGEVTISTASLSALLNDYVFNYEGTPLENLTVTVDDGQLNAPAMTMPGIMIGLPPHDGVGDSTREFDFDGLSEQEVRERNEIYSEVIGRFRALIDGGRLSVAVSRGRMVINLPQDILFASGSATVGPDGRPTLAEVGRVLAEFEDRSFQVEGHTDDVPISTARFPSNWELSTARALSVVQLLVESGVRPHNISGAGFGEYQPVAENDSPEGRRLNRRIEIVMLPNLDVIAGVQVRE
jgi:flagellar motor protein MotB